MRSSLATLPVLAGALLVTFAGLASCGSGERPPVGSLTAPDAAVDAGPNVFLTVSPPSPDPATCEAAASAHSYVGCDYWPTVMGNVVWSYFDYAVVVSNVSDVAATVTVTGPSSTNLTLTIDPGTLRKITLPWVPNLKGTDNDGNEGLATSVLERGGAYHLISSVPVVAYQFSALQYQRPYSGPAVPQSVVSCPTASECFSFTNDASLLLPSTAWTQSYRVSGLPGETGVNGGYAVIVASQPGTTVTTSLSRSGTVISGTGIPATAGGGKVTVTLDAGDVVELVTPIGSAYDLSGSLVTADKPVEVFTGNPCKSIPDGKPACDHVEESVLPAEALGNEYIVTTPTRPAGGVGAHVVRFYGNRDGTTLAYFPKKPGSCPDTLDAGDVVDCGSMITSDFIVQGSAEFALASFTASAQVYGATDPRGDPDQTIFASAKQFRTRYVFLAPTDYDVNYAVVAGASDALPVVDGQALGDYREISSGYGVWRIELARTSEAHVLTSTQPVSLQVMGYGAYTSYTYPGGLSLAIIAPPPILK